MGSLITYRIQQAMPAKLRFLHTRVQNSDEQFAPHCGANLKAVSVAALQAALGWWYVHDNIGLCPMLYLFEPFRLLPRYTGAASPKNYNGAASPKGCNRCSTGHRPVDMVPPIHDAACRAATDTTFLT